MIGSIDVGCTACGVGAGEPCRGTPAGVFHYGRTRLADMVRADREDAPGLVQKVSEALRSPGHVRTISQPSWWPTRKLTIALVGFLAQFVALPEFLPDVVDGVGIAVGGVALVAAWFVKDRDPRP